MLRNEKYRAMLMNTPGTSHAHLSGQSHSFARSGFVHLKTHHRFERMRLRGLSGARDEFHLAAIVQNLKTLASQPWRSPTDAQVATVI